jgi:hypothetical protein
MKHTLWAIDEGEQPVIEKRGLEKPKNDLRHSVKSAATESAERALRLAGLSFVLAILALTFGIVAALLR